MGPKSKTRNKSLPEKLSPTKNVVEDANALMKAAEIEDLIAQLCVDAPSDAVKFCLRSYQPGKSIKQIEKDIFQSKIGILLETSEYLRIPNCKGKTKTVLSRRILCRIQNLLPDNCGVCKNRYSIKLEECPLLECAICGQGVHRECWLNLLSLGSNAPNCTYDNNIVISEYVNPHKLPGIHYICPACEETTIPPDEESQQTSYKPEAPVNDDQDASSARPDEESQQTSDKAEAPVNDDQDAPSAITATLQPPIARITDNTETHFRPAYNDTPPINQLEEGSRNKVSTEETFNPVPEPAPNTESDNITEPSNLILDHAINSSKKSASVCRYFRRGTCRHGLRGNECKFTHPQMCRKYLQHGTHQPTGCNLGKRCKFFHPLMCMDSLRKSECYNDDCTYHHVKGTRRQPKHVQNHQGSTNHPPKPLSHEGNKESAKQGQADVSIHNNTSGDNNSNQADHFLEVVRLLKAELISSMNTQIATLSTQIQSIQQVQARQMIPHQMINYSHQRAYPPGLLHPPLTSQPLQQRLQQPQIQIQMPQMQAPAASPAPNQN